ncbi:MAG: DNA polymerase III subunit gamma/tau [Elusimicrobiota bacterium]
MSDRERLGLARKHRPQTFEDLVGQEAVSTTLRNAVKGGQQAHAYLFFGPRGVGKTTTARILAKALNCKDGPTPTPCGECPSCREISSGSSIDVLELDAASHTQVDKIREMIIETAALAPSRDRRKIFIIDEVHMLSTSSFNALLKTLEEPPAHVVFILATTELAKIPATIVSRCQRFRFRPISRELTTSYLAKLAKAEKIKVEDSALEALARASGGALRDAVSLLDQAAAFSGGAVTAEKAEALLGTLPAEFLLGIVGAILEKDGKSLSEWLGKASAEGFDAAQILRDLRERLHDLFLHRLGLDVGLDGGWKELASRHAPEVFSFLVRRVNSTLSDMRGSDSGQMAFELGIYGMLESAYDLKQWVGRLEALEKRLAGNPGVSTPAPKPTLNPPSSAVPSVPAPHAVPDAPRPGAKSIEEVWPTVLQAFIESKPSLAPSLQNCRMTRDETGRYKLLLSQAFDVERAKSNQAELEEALSRATGGKVRLGFDVDPEKGAHKDKPKKGQGDEGWLDSSDEHFEDPAVKKVLGVFGGRIKQVKKKS